MSLTLVSSRDFLYFIFELPVKYSVRRSNLAKRGRTERLRLEDDNLLRLLAGLERLDFFEGDGDRRVDDYHMERHERDVRMPSKIDEKLPHTSISVISTSMDVSMLDMY